MLTVVCCRTTFVFPVEEKREEEEKENEEAIDHWTQRKMPMIVCCRKTYVFPAAAADAEEEKDEKAIGHWMQRKTKKVVVCSVPLWLMELMLETPGVCRHCYAQASTSSFSDHQQETETTLFLSSTDYLGRRRRMRLTACDGQLAASAVQQPSGDVEMQRRMLKAFFSAGGLGLVLMSTGGDHHSLLETELCVMLATTSVGRRTLTAAADARQRDAVRGIHELDEGLLLTGRVAT